MNSKQVNVYTDGSCKINPGRGGWGWVEYHPMENGTFLEYTDCGGEKHTTNNKMELTAIIKFLNDAPLGRSYLIHSDSMYCLKGLVKDGNGTLLVPGKYTGWLRGWLIYGFKGKKNETYWRELDSAVRYQLFGKTRLEFRYVRGHSGDEGNDRADQLANMGVPRY